MKKKSLLISIVAMLFATGLTFGQKQHQYRPLPIYRYLNVVDDHQNVMDSSATVLAGDTVSIPYPNCPGLVWGGWDTAHIAGPYNFTLSYYATGLFYEFKIGGYSSTAGNLVTDQWYISPYFSTKKFNNVALNFVSKCSKYAGPAMTAMVTTKFRNELVDPAQWDTLASAIIPSPNGTATSPWTESGVVSIDGNKYNSDSVCIAFRYTSNTGAAANYYLDSISVTGTPMGINVLNAAATMVHVYPNPFTSTVTISNPSMINKIEVYNMVGELVTVYENVNNYKCTLNTENFQQGMYFTKILLKNGTIVSKKIVKE